MQSKSFLSLLLIAAISVVSANSNDDLRNDIINANLNGNNNIIKTINEPAKNVSQILANTNVSLLACAAFSKGIGITSGDMLMGKIALFTPPPYTTDDVFKKLYKNQVGEEFTIKYRSLQNEIDTLVHKISEYISVAINVYNREENLKIYSQIHDLISRNKFWFTRPGEKDKFVLCNPVGGKPNQCLHIDGFKKKDNAIVKLGEVTYDPQKPMVLSTNPSGNLYFYNSGFSSYCIAYKLDDKRKHSKDGNNKDYPMAIFRKGSKICNSVKITWSLRQNTDGNYELFDSTNDRMCAYDHKKKGNQIVNGARQGCKLNGRLLFKTKLTIPTKRKISDYNVNSRETFDEIGLQIKAFDYIALNHLNVLKLAVQLKTQSTPVKYMKRFENILPDDLRYKMDFPKYVQMYKDWIDYYVPMWSDYATIVGFTPDQIKDATKRILEFKEVLKNATLDVNEITMMKKDNTFESLFKKETTSITQDSDAPIGFLEPM